MRGPPGGDLVTPEYEVLWSGRGSLESREWPAHMASSCTLACAAGKTVDDIAEQWRINGRKAAAVRETKKAIPTVQLLLIK